MAQEAYQQLQLVWPEHMFVAPVAVLPPVGYMLRNYQSGDLPRFYTLMALAGWPGWNAEKMGPWQPRILSGGWPVVVDQLSNEIVVSAMALRSATYAQAGEVGWVAGDPAHAGQGLGTVVVAAVVASFIEEGYQKIHLYTEHWRLPALKIYLKLGFVPYLDLPQMATLWQEVCVQLDWPFTSTAWLVETDKHYRDAPLLGR